MATRKKSQLIVVIPSAILLYILLATEPLLPESVPLPVWIRDLTTDSVAGTMYRPVESETKENAGSRLIPYFETGKFGYFDMDGALVGSGTTILGIALSADGFSIHDPGLSKSSIIDPNGHPTPTPDRSGFAFFHGERRFLMRPDQSGLAEFDDSGRILWESDFPSIITCFDATANLTIVGLLDGHVLAFNEDGKAVYEKKISDSHIATVYGVAISSDGVRMAHISGTSPQTAVILERRGEIYSEIHRIRMSLELRRQIPCSFIGAGGTLAIEREGGISLLEVDSGELDFIQCGTLISPFITRNASSGTWFAVKRGGNSSLMGLTTHGRKLIQVPVRGNSLFLHIDEDSLFLTTAGRVMRFDLETR